MIGDVLTTSILFELLYQKFPDGEFHYLINSNTKPVIAEHPFITKFIELTPETATSSFKLVKLAFSLKKERYDIILDVYSKLSSNIISLVSSAKTKISKFKWYTSWIYSHPIRYNKESFNNIGLAIENRLQLLQPLEIKTNLAKPKIYLTDREINNAKVILESSGINQSCHFYMISVLGSGESKTYPFNYMAYLLNSIVKKDKNCQILFNYIPSQITEARAIYDLCSIETQKMIRFNVFGSSLREFLAFTKLSTALIGNEGGAINMAKALNIPTFAIFAPWIDKSTWNLFEDNSRHMSVHLKEFWPELYQDIEDKSLKKNYQYYYKLFKPELFEKNLIKFINQFTK